MAAAGYFVVAPDLFHGDPVHEDAMKKGFSFPPWIAKHGTDVIDPVIANTIKALREEYGVKKIGAVGYCFGGRYVLRFLAKGKGLDAGVRGASQHGFDGGNRGSCGAAELCPRR